MLNVSTEKSLIFIEAPFLLLNFNRKISAFSVEAPFWLFIISTEKLVIFLLGASIQKRGARQVKNFFKIFRIFLQKPYHPQKITKN